MLRRNIIAIFAASPSLVLAACQGQESERNIIVDQAPFVTKRIPYRERTERKIEKDVRQFARNHGMDFLSGPGHPTLDRDQFNFTAAGPNLNLEVVRIGPTLPDTQVSAIARSKPTDADQALFQAFVRQLENVR